MTDSLRETIATSGVVYGARVRTFSTTVIQIIGQVGLDYAYLDLEHAGFSPYDSFELEQRSHAAEKAGCELVVRVPTSDPSMIRTVLDAGIRTVLLPRIKTASEVKRALRSSRFQYDGEPGERGFGTSPANEWGIRPDGYTASEDAAVMIGIMLETESALANVDEILSVPELGFAKIGVGDLAVSLGHPQNYENEAVQNAVETFRTQCRVNDIPIGVGVSSTAEAKNAVEEGYDLVDIGGDLEVLRSVLNRRLDSITTNENNTSNEN